MYIQTLPFDVCHGMAPVTDCEVACVEIIIPCGSVSCVRRWLRRWHKSAMETLRWFNVEVIQTPTRTPTPTLMQNLGGNGPYGYDSRIAPVSTFQRVINSSRAVFKRQGLCIIINTAMLVSKNVSHMSWVLKCERQGFVEADFFLIFFLALAGPPEVSLQTTETWVPSPP